MLDLRPRSFMLPFPFCLVLLAGAAAPVIGQQIAPPALPAAKEELIAEKDAQAKIEDDWDTFCLDGQRVVWRTKRGSQWFVVVNGESQGPGVDEIGIVGFRHDCKRFMYTGKRGKKWIMIVDGQQVGSEADAFANAQFSPDSQHYAFQRRVGQKWVTIFDGQPWGPEYDLVYVGEEGSVVFSPDSRHLAVLARRTKKDFIIRDGKEGPGFDLVGIPIFSADSEHLLYKARRNKKTVGMEDDKEITPETDEIPIWQYIGNTRRTAIVGRIREDNFVFVDGKPGPAYDFIFGLKFSRESGRYAYSGVHNAFKGEKATAHVVIDGKEGPAIRAAKSAFWAPEYGKFLLSERGVSPPFPNGEEWRIAYVANPAKGEALVMIDHTAGPRFERIVAYPGFSSDGRRITYVGAEKENYTLVLHLVGEVAADNSRPTQVNLPASLPLDFAGGFVFSPDSRRVAFISGKGGGSSSGKRLVWLDGRPGKTYDPVAISGLTFSADSQHLAYKVISDKEDSSFVVLDGLEGKVYDKLLGGLKFSASEGFVYFAREGRKFFRVTQPLP